MFGHILVLLCIAFGVSTEHPGVLHVYGRLCQWSRAGMRHDALGLSGVSSRPSLRYKLHSKTPIIVLGRLGCIITSWLAVGRSGD